MKIAGIDMSSNAVDVVLLNLDDDHAVHHRVRLDDGPGDALTRCRRVRDKMPARGAWADAGVLAIFLEEPMGDQPKGLVPVIRVQGAVLACLPRQLIVSTLTPADWRLYSLGGGRPGKGNAKKEQVAAWARTTWPNPPARPTQDAFDAYCIAYAGRHLWQRRNEGGAAAA